MHCLLMKIKTKVKVREMDPKEEHSTEGWPKTGRNPVLMPEKPRQHFSGQCSTS